MKVYTRHSYGRHLGVALALLTGLAFTFSSANVMAGASKKAAAVKKKASDDDSLSLDSDVVPDLYKPEMKKPHRPVPELRTLLAKDDKNTDVRIELSEALQEKGDYAGMIEVLRPAADHLPRRGMLLLARAYGGNSDGLNEIRVLELVIAQNPKDYYAQTLTGEAYSRAKKHDEAVERFSEARKLNPQYEPAYTNLLKEYKMSNDTFDILPLVNDMVKNFGEKPMYLDQLCQIYTEQGYVDKALETCPKAMARDRDNPDNHARYSEALIEHEEIEKAQKVLETAARMFPMSESTQWQAGSTAFEKKDYLTAMKYFSQCVKADAKSARCWLHLGKSDFELQKNQDAVDAFAKACGLNRSYTGEIRKAAASLRMKKDYVWPQKYDVVINRCSAITGSGD